MQSQNIKKISRHDYFSSDFKTVEIKPNQKYQIYSMIVAYSGHFSSGCILATLFDKKNIEVGRYARFITDFSGTPKMYNIIFTTPPEAKILKVGLRFNVEYYTRSDLEFLLPDERSFEVKEVAADIKDSYDNVTGPTVELQKILNKKEEDDLEKNLVFILGSTRSGSTWFGLQLLNHKETILWNEPNFALFLGFLTRTNKKWNLSKKFNKLFSEQHKSSWLPQLRKLILQRTFSQFRTTPRKIIIKEPESEGSAFLMECLPHSKMIFLARDGRSVVDSWIDAHREGSWDPNRKPIRTAQGRIEKIKFYSNYWKNLTTEVFDAYQNHNPNLRLLLKYENLRKDTLTELKRVYEFLDIKIDDSEIEKIIDIYSFDKIPRKKKGKGKTIRAAKPDSWKKNFNSEEKKIMNSIMSSSLKKMDYPI